MKYQNLLLSNGCGIVNPATRSPQFSDAAALCIGIGGTGIMALSNLKGKIYQQLTPDNPGDPVPRYDGIQLLGIDSDDGAWQCYHGNRRLNRAEFFSINKDNLPLYFTTPQGKQLIKDDPRMNWMEIDKIPHMLSPEGAGGVRQVGRFQLMNKAASLYAEIANKCRLAMNTRGRYLLDIYIFAGLSGGTGSGCFLDVCYLIRHLAQSNGWDVRIVGNFFLPDVVISRPWVSCNPAAVAFNNSNAYAALKELDYLMDLKGANDWFEQDYNSGLRVRTQEAPVDVCNLISCQRADGSLMPDGFEYGINVATDYVMSYLAEVAPSSVGWVLTTRAHLTNVTRGVQGIPRRWGANLSYHILGACCAELPRTQINTYLASGFFRRFAREACIPRDKVTREAVQKLMTYLQLGADDIYHAVAANTRELHLPELDRNQLASEPVYGRGRLPRVWADCFNNWMAESEGIMVTNANGLTKKLDSFGYQEADGQSLIGRLFRKLWDMCVDPEFGPYYTAYLLKNNGDDLISALTGEIRKADDRENAMRIQLYGMEDIVVECNERLVYSNIFQRRRAYEAYYLAVTDYLNTQMAYIQCYKTAEVLRIFRSQVEELYNTFFRPLIEMLDNLLETFDENNAYLRTDEARQTNAYTWQILTLDDIKPRLDLAINNLNVKQLVTEFVQDLLSNSDNWLKNDENKIVAQISDYMLKLFGMEANRSLEDYLLALYPHALGNPWILAQIIESNILQRVHTYAVPVFWCDPTYSISDPSFTFESSSLSVPGSCSAICSAANNFAQSHNRYVIRQTGIEDRIFALRFVSGIPLFAYQGITRLKYDYDTAAAGIHLYAATGRGNCRDWRTWLPDPVPVHRRRWDRSVSPAENEAIELYHKAVDCGVIGLMDSQSWRPTWGVFVTPPLELSELREGLTPGECANEIDRLQSQLATMHDFRVNPDCRPVELRNDGDKNLSKDPETVRIDHFVRFPVLQELAREELNKRKILEERLHMLQKNV